MVTNHCPLLMHQYSEIFKYLVHLTNLLLYFSNSLISFFYCSLIECNLIIHQYDLSALIVNKRLNTFNIHKRIRIGLFSFYLIEQLLYKSLYRLTLFRNVHFHYMKNRFISVSVTLTSQYVCYINTLRIWRTV